MLSNNNMGHCADSVDLLRNHGIHPLAFLEMTPCIEACSRFNMK